MSDEFMTDAELDREIEQALAVEPSPGFVARVQAHTADESAPGFWRLRTFVLATAAAAAAVLLLFAVAGREVPTHVLVNGEDVYLPSTQSAGDQPSDARAAAEETVVKRNTRSAAASVVQISPDEIEGLRRMIIAARDGQLAASMPSEALDVEVPALSKPEIRILPVVIEPIGE